MPSSKLEKRSINALRVLAMDAIQHANSGHPGLPMGMADVAYVLWMRQMQHNPRNPEWPNRDRFILSAGHGSMLLYGLLYLTGYPMLLADLQNFRQWESKTPGHPEYDPEIGIETTTGPLGQGFANGVGMAMAQKHLAARFNRPDYPIFDHYVYAIVSDGDLMEGVSQEAASLAGHLKLDKLIYFYDDNDISIAGSTNLTFSEDVPARFRAYGWHVQTIDGHDPRAIDAAIEAAQKAEGQPHLIVARTQIAHGSPNLAGSEKAHGSPLGAEEVRLTKDALDWPSQEPFFIPEDVVAHYRLAIPRGERAEAKWQDLFTSYEKAYPEDAKELKRLLQGELPEGWEESLPYFRPDAGPIATRAASGKVLNALAPVIPELVGGSADLAPSTKTYLSGEGEFQPETPEGRNIRFGVREHAMGSILNGMALYNGLRVYGGTFLIFSDYMRPAIRMSALMKLPVVYVLTHDSIYLGEDGPTHEPVEQLMSLRAIPNLTVIRPADANETAAAWQVALQRRGPVALALTRQKLPTLVEVADKAREGMSRGAYVLSESPLDRVDLILIATGSEVADALEAQKLLKERRVGARVVSMPSWEIFEEQPLFYRISVFPNNVIRRLSIEAGITLGWHRYVGSHGSVMGLDHFGASAPYKKIKEEFHFTPADIADRALKLMAE